MWKAFGRRRRFADLWHDEGRTRRTLESFARTERGGASDIEKAARRTLDPWLREHLLRHAADERRHGEMFEALARSLADAGSSEGDREIEFELISGSRDRGDVNAHGFLASGEFDDFDDVEFVAMLHVAEKKAAALFAMQRDLTAHRPEVQRAFADILKDERYHVSYTHAALQRMRESGRGREVSRALAAARGQRALGAWKRLGARVTANLGRLLLFATYFTVLVPFALLARVRRREDVPSAPRFARPSDTLRSQYL